MLTLTRNPIPNLSKSAHTVTASVNARTRSLIDINYKDICRA